MRTTLRVLLGCMLLLLFTPACARVQSDSLTFDAVKFSQPLGLSDIMQTYPDVGILLGAQAESDMTFVVGSIDNKRSGETFLLVERRSMIDCGNHGCPLTFFVRREQSRYDIVPSSIVVGPEIWAATCSDSTIFALSGGKVRYGLWKYDQRSLTHVNNADHLEHVTTAICN